MGRLLAVLMLLFVSGATIAGEIPDASSNSEASSFQSPKREIARWRRHRRHHRRHHHRRRHYRW